MKKKKVKKIKVKKPKKVSPNALFCSVCGVCKGNLFDARKERLIKRFGSLEAVHSKYVCRACNSNADNKNRTNNKLYCSKCKACNGNLYGVRKERLIGIFGSIEAVHEKYVCRKCRKEHNVRRDGRLKPVRRKRKPNPVAKYRDAEGNIHLPEWMTNMHLSKNEITRPCTAEDLKKIDVCWRQDLWLANDKHCPYDCPYHLKDACGDNKNFKANPADDYVKDTGNTKQKRKYIKKAAKKKKVKKSKRAKQ